MKTKNIRHIPKKAWIIIGITAVLVGIAALIVTQAFSTKPNYAAETAKPIEQALVDAEP